MESSGFFDAKLEGSNYDRVYLSAQFASYFSMFIGNGVFIGKARELQVTALATPKMQVNVLDGYGYINGYWYNNDSASIKVLDSADGVLNRIDSIVLRLDFTNRSVSSAVKKGTPAVNPVAPTLTRTVETYEIQLATVNIRAGALVVNQANITDTRFNSNLCGQVKGIVDQIDTTDLFAQYNAAFNAWFADVQGSLSDDVAGNLLNKINDKIIVINKGSTILPANRKAGNWYFNLN